MRKQLYKVPALLWLLVLTVVFSYEVFMGLASLATAVFALLVVVGSVMLGYAAGMSR